LWLHSLKVAQLLRSAACLHTNQSRSYLNHLVFTYRLTPWSTALLEKLTGSLLVKKFPAFYGTRRFITLFTSACHLSLSEPDQSSPSPIPHSEVPSSNLMSIIHCLVRTKGSVQV